MHIRLALDKGYQGKTLAWALDYPGCFSYGEDDAEVLLRIPGELLKFETWIKDHTDLTWIDFTDLDLNIVEVVHSYTINEGYLPSLGKLEINAFFRDDWRPLNSQEIDNALLVFKWQREELLAGLGTLSIEILEKQRLGQRWNILGIVKHIANAENWYLDRLGFTSIPKADLPKDPIKRLNLLQKFINSEYLKFEGDGRVQGVDGELWSCRKILRRTLWHQRDHIDHIKQLVFDI
ncbi:MAG: hypothetical protein MUO40_08280 [Anaerolineaceae bacterium]|nr:hypothetical protein [Anaerolineaceae bacterium]